MECPACLQPMDSLSFMNIEIDSCRFCGGVWFDGGELANFVMKGKVPGRILSTYCLDDSRKIRPPGERTCPRCGNCLVQVEHRGVNVEHCPDCNGLWFERGRLLTIMKSYKEKISRKRKPLKDQGIVFQIDDQGDEIFRIEDDEYFEEEEPAGEPAPKEDNPVSREIMAAGSKESIIQAIPKSALEERDKSSLDSGGFMDVQTSPGLTHGAMSPLNLTGRRHKRGIFGDYHEDDNTVTGDIIIDGIIAFVKTFFESSRYK